MQQHHGSPNRPSTRLAALLQEWRDGSDDALQELLLGCRRYLMLAATRQIGPDLRAKGDTSDLAQESLLEIRQDLIEFRDTTEEELIAWLQRILRNNIANFRRRYRQTAKRAVNHEISLDHGHADGPLMRRMVRDSTSPSGRFARTEDQRILNDALDQLSHDHRTVVQLRHRQQLSFREIGRQMNRSPDAARMLWARALQQLAALIEDHHGQE